MLRNPIAMLFVLSLLVLVVIPVPALAGPGDANGDGVVDSQDFDIWYQNRFLAGTDVLTGDFTGDGLTDGQDFIVWNTYKTNAIKNNTGVLQVQNVPEPSSFVLLLLSVAVLRARGNAVKDF